MDIKEFAEAQRLKITKDSCGDAIIQGRLYRDANISEHDDGMLAMCFLVDGRSGTPSRQGLFNRVKKECLIAGMRLHQEGDSEAVFVFDPTDKAQSKLAIKAVRARVKRQMTPEQVAALSSRLLAARNSQKTALIST
jgi:hypothetical protein